MGHRQKNLLASAHRVRTLTRVAVTLVVMATWVCAQARDTAPPPRDAAQARPTNPAQSANGAPTRDAAQARITPQTAPTPPSAVAAERGSAAFTRDTLGAGDSIRITVFQNPDLTTEARLSQGGAIVFPLIGEVALGGLTAAEAGSRIAEQLKRGNFIVNPQVAVSIVQVRSRQVHVLGQLSRPGNYILEDSASRLTDVLTLAGGISATGADTVTVLTNRAGKVERHEIDVPAIFHGGDPSTNIQIENGDTIYVERAPVFYIYGEVQRAGAYRLEPNMIVMQALSLGSGLTPRANERGIGIHRRMPNGKFVKLDAKLTDPILADDIVFVRESLF
jgi:polysaccharide export outer membrane protein